MFPVQHLVPSFLTRVVLCAGKEAWKRRPFLLSSQICSNYRITSICGSLAAFSLPPPPLSSPVFSLFPSPLFHLHSPLFLIFQLLFFWYPLMRSELFFSFFLCKTTAHTKFMIIRTSWRFWQTTVLFGDSIRPWLPKEKKKKSLCNPVRETRLRREREEMLKNTEI